MAKEVRQGLVCNPAHYGVVLLETDEVDSTATTGLRSSMSSAQNMLREQGLFNRGGTLAELADTCLVETGFQPPKPPSSRVLRGPIAQLKHITELHERRRVEDVRLF